MAKAVVVLGGNALGKSSQEQPESVENTAKSLVGLITKGCETVINHGNGPQIGGISFSLSYAAERDQDPVSPFAECGVMSQAYIGYQPQENLQNELHSIGINKQVVTPATQVEADKGGPAFNSLSKPIGLFYTEEETNYIQQERGYQFVEGADRSYHHVVPSPQPISTIELESVKTLVEDDTLVIAAGGGGVPVIREQHDSFKGIGAVIDEDKTGALLSADIHCDQLITSTAIDYVYINYHTDQQQAPKTTNIDTFRTYTEEEQFVEGNMLPKVESVISFIEDNPNGNVLITSLSQLDVAPEGKIGTLITKRRFNI